MNHDDIDLGTKLSSKKMYLHDSEVHKLEEEGYDVVLLLFEPADPTEDYYVYCRWIGIDYKLNYISQTELDGKYEEFKGRLPHDGWEVMRYGGSNGRVAVNRWLFDLMHTPSICPRISCATMWIAAPDMLTWHICYINCKQENQRVVTAHKYAQPKPGGQFTMKDKDADFNGSAFGRSLKTFVKTKALMPHLCAALSQELEKRQVTCRAIASAACEVQLFTNYMAKQNTKTEDDFYAYLLKTCKTTMLMYAVDKHKDTASKFRGKHPLKGKTNAFFENKRLHVYEKGSSNRKTGSAQGRGGARFGKFVWGLVDHSYTDYVNAQGQG
jgi:hypothetical protein